MVTLSRSNEPKPTFQEKFDIYICKSAILCYILAKYSQMIYFTWKTQKWLIHFYIQLTCLLLCETTEAKYYSVMTQPFLCSMSDAVCSVIDSQMQHGNKEALQGKRYMSAITQMQKLGVSTSCAPIWPESCLGGVPRGLSSSLTSLPYTVNCLMVASIGLCNPDTQDFSACIMSDTDEANRITLCLNTEGCFMLVWRLHRALVKPNSYFYGCVMSDTVAINQSE